MALADHSGTRIAYVAEATYGVTPATPTFKAFRTTRAAGLRTNKTTGVSEEIRADRNVSDEFLLGLDCAGDYPVEMSYGSFDDWLEAGLMGAWTTNVLKNGVLRKSFTVEETRELGATDSFSRFTGVMANQIQFTLNGRSKFEATIGCMGQKEALATAIVTGATYGAPSTEPVLTASTSVASLTLPGIGAAGKVRSLSWTVNNNLRTRPVVGSVYSEEFGVGRCDVTGTMEVYFENNTLYQAVLDHSGGALSFVTGLTANKKYAWSMPNLKFLDGQVPNGGNTDDVMVSIPFRALFDPGINASLQVTRAVA